MFKHLTGSRRVLTIVVGMLVVAGLACGPFGPRPAPTVPPSTAGPAAGTARPTVDIADLPPTVPQVVAQRPYPSEELPLDGSIDIYFDQPMDQASVEEALAVEPAIDTSLNWVDDATLRITPNHLLDRAARYTVTISDRARSQEGLSFEEPVTIEVQTVGFLEVGEVVPASDSTGVEADSVITVLFNRPVVPLVIVEDMDSLPQPLEFEPDIPGEGEWLNTSIYMWHPAEALAGGQTYTVTVKAGLEDQTGGVLEDDYTWQFTTLPPSVTSVEPSAGAEDIPLDVVVQVEFNQPMDRASVQAAFSLQTAEGQDVAGVFSWDDESCVMGFDPDGLLALDGHYRAELTTDAQGASGEISLDQAYTWEFDAVKTPAIIDTEPANGASSAYPWGGIHISFASPMDEESLEGKLVVTPELPDTATIYYDSWNWGLHVNTALEPSTQYTVTFAPGASDPYGNQITEPYTFSFTTAPLDPLVQLNVIGQFGLYDAAKPTQLFVLYRNISRLDFQLSSISLEEFGRLTGPGSYEYREAFRPSSEQLVREWSTEAEGELNEATYARVPVVSEAGGSLDPGIYVLIVDAPEIRGDLWHFMIVSTANLTLKMSFDESLAWLTDLQTGEPIAGVPVTFYNQNFREIAQVTTGPDGIVNPETPHLSGLWDLQYAIADDGETFAVAMSEWSEGLDSWQFGLPSQFFFEDLSLYVHTDRPLYRPGQEVFFRGVLRDKDDVTYSLPERTEIRVTIFDPEGNEVFTDRLPVDEYGVFNGSITLDSEAALGYYSIQGEIGAFTSGVGFQVAEYRKPEFIVNLEAEQEAVLAGDTIRVTVDAEFFFGGPVSDTDVSWTALSDTYNFVYTGPGNYSFFDYNRDEFEGLVVLGYGEVIAEGTGTTDADGQFVIELPADLGDSTTSRRLTLEAVVTDINGRSVAGRTEVVVHKGEFYVGIRPDVYIGGAGEEQTASLIVVDWDSNPIPGHDVVVEVVERRWNSVREEDEFGRMQWVWSVEEIPAGDPILVTTDDRGLATVAFTPPSGGVYKIKATVTDDAGNEVRASTFMWVSGADFISWRQANNNRIELIADKELYQPGDVAEVLITSPFQGDDVQALITIERGSILSYEVITLPSNSYVHKIPITGALAPNVYVSVILIKGVDDTNPTPAFRMGLVALEVDTVEQEIQLVVTPDREEVGPGEDVTYTVEALDYQGNPVDAEVSLALVDLATLSLALPNSGPIVSHFYGNQGLGVRTAMPLSFSVDTLNQELFDRGKGGGGGGAEGFFDVRTEFEDTAYWSATMQTGEDGKATVTITLPDNLTTWRMDARAVTQDTLVGQAEVDIVATKPLLIRPVTPRFFVVDDEATLSAVVNNNTGTAIEAVVSLEAQGVTLLGDAAQSVTIPAGGRVEVTWPVVVESDVEWVDLVFGVQGGSLQDASKPPLGDPAHDRMLPVYRYEVPETVGTAGQLIDPGVRIEGIVLPPTYDVTQGELLVELDPTLAAGMIDGLDWLEHYEYECTEQTVSRFLPNVLTLRAYRDLGLSDPALERNLERVVREGLQKLYSQQHVDGGWGWFVTSDSSPTVTAYVIQGLVAAKEAGFSVENRVLRDGIRYLEGQLVPVSSLRPQFLDRQAYILYVLAKAGEPDVSRTNQLYEERETAQHWARALLAQTLWLIDADDERIDNIQSDLVNDAILSATGAHWEEEFNDWWNWNTDTRSTAIILSTFAQLWPENDLAPNVVRWLMVAREGGHWETTQETAWALIGLTDWMVATGELEADYAFEVEFNGRPLVSGEANEDTFRDPTVLRIDVAEMLRDEVNRLAIERMDGPGRLYYTAHLTAYLPVEKVEPLSRGIIVSRQYFDENSRTVTQGRVGDVLTVRLTIIAPHDLYYVVVEDPYPAGAEAIDLGLQTESVLGERPVLRPDDPLARGWGWWWFSHTELRDEKAVLFADFLPAGTYQYTYQIRLGIEGVFRVIPSVAREFYFPEVYGRGEGLLFTVLPER